MSPHFSITVTSGPCSIPVIRESRPSPEKTVAQSQPGSTPENRCTRPAGSRPEDDPPGLAVAAEFRRKRPEVLSETARAGAQLARGTANPLLMRAPVALQVSETCAALWSRRPSFHAGIDQSGDANALTVALGESDPLAEVGNGARHCPMGVAGTA